MGRYSPLQLFWTAAKKEINSAVLLGRGTAFDFQNLFPALDSSLVVVVDILLLTHLVLVETFGS